MAGSESASTNRSVRFDRFGTAELVEPGIRVPASKRAGMQQQRRTERAFFETDRVRVVGDLTLPPSGYQSRFSDSLNRGEFEFVPLTDAEITTIESGAVEKRPFVLIAKRHVRLAFPIED